MSRRLQRPTRLPSTTATVESTINKHSSDEREPTLTARATGGSGSAYLTLFERTRPVAPGLEHHRAPQAGSDGRARAPARPTWSSG